MNSINNKIFSALIGIIAILTGTIGCFFLLYSNASAEEVINISTGEYPPWTGKELLHGGFVNHVITEAFKMEGYTVKYKYYPWKRAYILAEAGKVQATSYWSFTDKRKADFYASDPIMVEKTFFFHLKSNPIKDWRVLGDLRGYRIGVTDGYSYSKEFWEAEKNEGLTFHRVTSDIQNFKKLLSKRIDIFPSGLVAAKKILRELDKGQSQLITYHPKALTVEHGHLLFPKKNSNSEQLVAILNQGLIKLKVKGLYDEYVNALHAGKYDK